MKMNKLAFAITTATLLMFAASSSLAMDLNIKTLNDSDNTATTSNSAPSKTYTPPINLGSYPSKISFIIGYTRVTVKNAEPSSVILPPNQDVITEQLTSAPLNGIKLGLTQFITPNWGYEFATNYYLSQTYSVSNSSYYDSNETAYANAIVDNKLWTVEALAVGGWHISQNWLLLGKLGVGYEYLTQNNPLTATVVYNGDPNVVTHSNSSTYKAHSPGIAGGAGIRYSLTNNFSFEMGLNDLMGKRNLLIYEANLLIKA